MKHSIVHGLPELEHINEEALKNVPVQLRLILAPLLYNVWKNLFLKNHISLPEGFSIEDFVCKGITHNKCHEILEKWKEDENKITKAPPDAVIEKKDENEDDNSYEVRDFDLADALEE